uniref:uncharacterized protein LOC120342498 isoform X1 n=1 Tax=Styela clava TaxID=7725 RepID=UPI00193AC607|nr:uncharacterized protein LOC120342498 isoform X1 [Styela clava]
MSIVCAENNVREDIQDIEISIKKIISPTKFWAQIMKDHDIDAFQSLSEDIQQYFSDATFSKSRLSNPVEGKRCVVKKDDRTWHRAFIDKVFVSARGLIMYCNLVDEVDYSSIPSQCVYEAPAWVWNHPIRSACFGLYGIAPLRLRTDYADERVDIVESRNLERWDEASNKHFQNMCKGFQSLGAQIIEVDEKNVIWIKLFSQTGEKGESFCVNEELIKYKYAAVKSVKKLNSAGDSDESDKEGKYLSLKQLTALRDNLSTLLKENTKHPKWLSDTDSPSSDGSQIPRSSDDVHASGVLSSHKIFQNLQSGHFTGDQNVDPTQNPSEYIDGDVRKFGGENLLNVNLNDFIGDNVITSSHSMLGNHPTNLLPRSSLGINSTEKLDSKGSSGRLLPHASSDSTKMINSRTERNRIAIVENSQSSKGVPLRSIAMQTGLDSSSDSEEEKFGLKSFGTQVNFDDDGITSDKPQLKTMEVFNFKEQSGSQISNVQTSISNSDSLLEDYTMKSCRKEMIDQNFKDQKDIINIQIQSQGGNGSLKSYTSKVLPRVNDFYVNAPLVNIKTGDNCSDGKLQEDNIEHDHSENDEYTKEVKEPASSLLQTVFIPDNLHSGSVILIRGVNPPDPISLFCKSPFPSDILHLMESTFRYKGPRLIQAHAWPAIISHRDVLAIAPTSGGKTIAYLVPIVHMILRNKEHDIGSKQPIAVIVTADWSDVQNLHEMFETFFFDEAKEIGVVAVYGGTHAEKLKASEIASGCSVLICTPPALLRMFEAKYMNFSRLQFLVLDDINVLAEEFTEELKEVMKHRVNTLTMAAAHLKPHKPSQLICMGSQWTEGVHSFSKRFMKHQPLLLISHPLEAAVYGNVQHRVITCHEGQRTDHVSNILQHWEENKHGGISIFVEKPEDVERIQSIVQSLGYYCLQAHSNMCQWEIDEVRRQFEDESCSPVLVATDDIITELDIYSMQMVIHFSFPMSQHKLGLRLSTMQTYFRSKENLDDCVLPSSYFLMSMNDCHHASDLMRFLERVGQSFPKELSSLVDFASKAQNNVKTTISLCPVMKSFGLCRDESICSFRHKITAIDGPNLNPKFLKIPTSGHVCVQITHIVDATHYYARPLAIKNESNNQILTFKAGYAKLTMDMAMYFSQENHLKRLSEDPVPDTVYAIAKSYDRVCVLRLAKPDEMNKKDVKEWSTVKNKADKKSLVCWTTPGGARKTCVRLVDTGSVRIIRCDELLKLPKNFTSIPFQAIEVIVCGARPVDKDTKWLAQANEFIHNHIYNKELEGNIVAALGHTIWLHPAVIRSKLPLTKCTVTDFNVTQELIKMKSADKNFQQLEIIKKAYPEISDGANVIPQIERNTTSRKKLLNQQPSEKCRNRIFMSSVALEKSVKARSAHDDVTAVMSDTETKVSLQSIKKRSESLSSSSSTLSSPSSNDKENADSSTVTGNNFSQSKNSVPVGGDVPTKPYFSETSISELRPQTYSSDVAQKKDEKQDQGILTEKGHITDDTGSLHLLGSLCDHFCNAESIGINRTKILHEIHMRAVGAFYDLTEKDMTGLAKVLHNTKNIQESRIVIGALLSLSIDQVPVASFVKLSHLVKLGCSLSYKVLQLDEKRLHLAEDIFRLCQAIIESIQHNTRVVKNCLALSDVNGMIYCIEKYLRSNMQQDVKLLDEAGTTLHMLVIYKKELMSKTETKETNNNVVEKMEILNKIQLLKHQLPKQIQNPITSIVCKCQLSEVLMDKLKLLEEYYKRMFCRKYNCYMLDGTFLVIVVNFLSEEV